MTFIGELALEEKGDMDSRYGAEQKSWLVGKVWSERELSGKFSFNSSVN